MARFPSSWRFATSAPNLSALPGDQPLEVAFAGRSNVGKSSLINRLTATRGLARTSNTPGRTQALNFFVPDDGADVPSIALVDMPGYGFAKAPKAMVDAWQKLIATYLKGRSRLRRVFVLVDSRHGLKANDTQIMDMLDKAAVSYQVVLTKSDKIKPAGVERLLGEVGGQISKRPAAHPEIIATSSQSGDGLDEIRGAILAIMAAG